MEKILSKNNKLNATKNIVKEDLQDLLFVLCTFEISHCHTEGQTFQHIHLYHKELLGHNRLYLNPHLLYRYYKCEYTDIN